MPLPPTALTPGPDLYPWDISPSVVEAQELLNAHGFQVPTNGDFDWRTETAVKFYQRRHQLRVDGIIGPQTWSSLKATVKPGSRILKEGDSGADVYELQGLLLINGHVLKRDGVFGEETKSVVTAFQERHHLRTDGIVTPVTWAVLAGKRPLSHS